MEAASVANAGMEQRKEEVTVVPTGALSHLSGRITWPLITALLVDQIQHPPREGATEAKLVWGLKW
ncbi:hypothetical protein E2C01_049451 [Portunus trituberculatus]|uniref:Uncharacterized protein n=1 Tax=Portunus trituberculatus TaxID=210409 RepID=A0A5B7GE02_PORTR|nr:hypothetical protein [Portunus trituberculatus]